MLANRRRSERSVCRKVAKIQCGNGSLPRDCTITDVSDGGVRVIAENLDIPAQFTIIFGTGCPRQCRLAWRIGCEFGAEFIDGIELRQFGKRQTEAQGLPHTGSQARHEAARRG